MAPRFLWRPKEEIRARGGCWPWFLASLRRSSRQPGQGQPLQSPGQEAGPLGRPSPGPGEAGAPQASSFLGRNFPEAER